MGDVTAHFSRSEFVCRHCGEYRGDLEHLCEHLERLRAAVGRPCVIVSGYRCPAHNRAVGGASQSRHLYGDAVDLEHGYATEAQAAAAGFTGVGRYSGYATHVDLRPGGPARWDY